MTYATRMQQNRARWNAWKAEQRAKLDAQARQARDDDRRMDALDMRAEMHFDDDEA